MTDQPASDASSFDSNPSGPPSGREPLISGITTFLSGQDPTTLDEIRHTLARELDEAGPGAIAALCARLAQTGEDWHYYARDPLARRIHELLAERLLARESAVAGIEHIAAVAGRPVVICANHLSYSDANVLEILIQRAGGAALSDRLTVIAGPKVYSSLKRRFSSLAFGTIRVPQNSGLATEEAVMPPREVARAARRSIEAALERLRLGEALLVFAEGTRSRSRGMQPMLAAAARYFDAPGTLVLPVGLVGTEALFPIGEQTFRPVPITVRLGRPIHAAALRQHARGNRRLMMDCVGVAIASLLPAEYRGAYAADDERLHELRAVLSRL